MYITRKQYDAMMDYYPSFMKNEYQQLTKKWFVGGVLIGGNYKIVSEMAELVNTISEFVNN